jgi:hypothetical protein
MPHIEAVNPEVDPEFANDTLIQQALASMSQGFVDRAADILWERCLGRIEEGAGKAQREFADCAFIKNVFIAGLMSGFSNGLTTTAEMAAHLAMGKQYPPTPE